MIQNFENMEAEMSLVDLKLIRTERIKECWQILASEAQTQDRYLIRLKVHTTFGVMVLYSCLGPLNYLQVTFSNKRKYLCCDALHAKSHLIIIYRQNLSMINIFEIKQRKSS